MSIYTFFKLWLFALCVWVLLLPASSLTPDIKRITSILAVLTIGICAVADAEICKELESVIATNEKHIACLDRSTACLNRLDPERKATIASIGAAPNNAAAIASPEAVAAGLGANNVASTDGLLGRAQPRESTES